MAAPIGIPALSVKQPWANLILAERKTIELRTFPPKYSGDIWLHTGREPDFNALEMFDVTDPFLGGYVGIVTLASAVPLDEVRWERWRDKHLDPGKFTRGYFAWFLRGARQFQTPFPAPGNLKLYYPPTAIQARLADLAIL